MPGKQVFISYSHDSAEHREKVLGLAERLRQDGLDAQLDQYVNGTPEQGWPRWMLDQFDTAGFVLVVCTETYYRRFRGHEVPGRGKGVNWEGALITQEIYDAQSRTVKFVPVMLSANQERFIPEPLRGRTHYELTSEGHYQEMYRFLLGQAGIEPSPLGVLRPIPKRTAPSLTFSPAPEPASPLSTVEPVSPYAAGPPIVTDAGLFGRWQPREQIAEALVRCQPVQLLGERRMGKTSLLRWVERHAGEYRPGWPVAWVDAGALADRSPEGLVRAIAGSLGWKQSSASAEALENLLPLVLLVDEAGALAAPGHHFDASFLGLLRAVGQRQRLAWLSTSHADLHALFREDHLTSPFLNDSSKLQVGALEKEAAEALLDQGLRLDRAAVAAREAGRLPYPLQWIADALFRGQPPGRAADALREAMEPAFDGWWRSGKDEGQRLLGACVEGVELAGLASADRRRLRRLVDRGLVIEEEERFSLPGAAWRDFVAERRNG
jgi:hypothetical protein